MTTVRDPNHTRKVILESAFREIHHKGFKAASLNDILAETGLTKGALYHHFPNKKALGSAALDLIEEDLVETWLTPLEAGGDPIDCLQEIMRAGAGNMSRQDIVLGCPLNNLAQEMSPVDEDFRRRIVEIYDRWRHGLATAFGRGQSVGQVSENVDTLGAATFFVAALTGGRGLAKVAQTAEMLSVSVDGLVQYLESLRPA